MEGYAQMLTDLRASFASGKTRTHEWRIAQLKAVLKYLQENGDKLCEALQKDLHKPKAEAYVMEIGMCINDTIDAINNLDSWMKPEKVSKGAIYIMDSAYIMKEPFGVSLIMGAWNYPVQLVFLPLIGAISAGNCAVIKPSEISPATAEFLAESLPKYWDNDCFKIVLGGVAETTELLKERFDMIFYTGNSAVGKIVMQAAAKYLTPVVLELGGKSPVYVDKNTDLATVGRRLAWGKFCNAGQTCIAPDYVMCPKDIQDELAEKTQAAIEEFYTKDPHASDSYGRIVNERHFQRIQKLTEGLKAAYGNQVDEKEKFIAPTIFKDVQLTDPIMQDEIFGPLMPIVPVQNHQEAIKIINDREKPLALYVFTNNKQMAEEFQSQTSSGGLLINDTVVHAGLTTLPFGGIGNSGMGAYHGKHSFDVFSHNKPVLSKSLGMDQVNSLRYPPYTEKKLGWINWIMRKKVKRGGVLGFLPFMILGTMLAVFFKTLGVTAQSVESRHQ